MSARVIAFRAKDERVRFACHQNATTARKQSERERDQYDRDEFRSFLKEIMYPLHPFNDDPEESA